MRLILQETVVGLGQLGDVVKVRPGYGRNFLVPMGKAVPATKEHLAAFEQRRAELEKAEAEKLAAAQARMKEFDAASIDVAMQASEEGRLYGSVTPLEVVKAFADAGKVVEKSEVIMGEPIRSIGEHAVVLKFHPTLEVSIQVNVVAIQSEDAA